MALEIHFCYVQEIYTVPKDIFLRYLKFLRNTDGLTENEMLFL